MTGGSVVGGLFRVMVAYFIGVLLHRRWRDVPPAVPAAAFALLPALLFVQGPVILDFLFVLVGCPLLIASGLRVQTRLGGVLGELSFPLYAVHGPILIAARDAGLGWAVGVLLVLGFAGSLALGRTVLIRTKPLAWRSAVLLRRADAERR